LAICRKDVVQCRRLCAESFRFHHGVSVSQQVRNHQRGARLLGCHRKTAQALHSQAQESLLQVQENPFAVHHVMMASFKNDVQPVAVLTFFKSLEQVALEFERGAARSRQVMSVAIIGSMRD
jgi:hypothetical protein